MWVCAAAGVMGTIAFAQTEDPTAKLPPYTATQVQYVAGRGGEMRMKIMKAGGKFRMDLSPELQTIYRWDQNRAYNLMGKNCVYVSAQKATMLPSPLELITGTNVKRKALGNETVEGHPCNVEEVTLTSIRGEVIKSKVWLAQDLRGIPVKIESQTDHGAIAAYYRDIVIGIKDQSVFDAPKNCIPFEKAYTIAK
jgi:hypothetical protein